MSQSQQVYDFISQLDQGVIVVDTNVISSQVQNEYLDLFGNDLNLSANTPQGMLITAETLARVTVAENNVALANQINPNVAGGIFLDAIMALTNPFIRTPSTPSVVFATLNGVSGTVIPAGSIVSETGSGNSNQFMTIVDNTIPMGGALTNVQFNSIVNGPIPSNAGTLTVIVTPVLGWNTVTNSTAVLLGTLTQPDSSARNLRNTTLASQGASTAQAITAAVLNAGASSIFLQENTTDGTLSINSVSMVSHSIYACINNANIGTNSQVLATLTGTPTTSITAGSQVSSNGNVFSLNTTTVIPGGGSISNVLFTALSTGPIPVPPGTLTTIVTPISGWASVTNPADVTVLGMQSPIAQAIVSKKSAGAAYNNGPGVNVSAVVNVPFSGQLMTVLFDTPNPIAINIVVNIKLLGAVQFPTQVVQNAILLYSTGGIDGFAGLVVGQSVSSFELASAITSQNPAIYVQSLYIAKVPTAPTSSAEIPIQIYEIATISAGNIFVNIL